MTHLAPRIPQFTYEALLEGFAGAKRNLDKDGLKWCCRVAGSKLVVYEPRVRRA